MLLVTGNSCGDRKQLSMTSSPEVNWSSQRNSTFTKDVGPTEHLAWLLCFVLTFVVGLIINVLVAYSSARWQLLQTRLRHFRSLADALVGQSMSGVLSCCCGLSVVT